MTSFDAANLAAKVDAIREQAAGQKTAAPLAHYERIWREADPQACAARSGVAFDAEAGTFRTKLLGSDVIVAWPELACTWKATGEAARPDETILLACLLLEGRLAPATGGFKDYTQLQVPWGQHYYGAFRGRCINRLAGTYGGPGGIERLTAQAQALGATPAPGGDAAFDFEFLPGVTVRFALWEADEEFPASAQITFSDNADLALSAESWAVAGDVIFRHLRSA